VVARMMTVNIYMIHQGKKVLIEVDLIVLIEKGTGVEVDLIVLIEKGKGVEVDRLVIGLEKEALLVSS